MIMGFRKRLKSKLKETISNAKALATVIHEESNHPGRPSPHMAARNPMWGGEDTPLERSESDDEHETNDTESPSNAETEDGEFWFLNYDDVDGWDATNPNEEK